MYIKMIERFVCPGCVCGSNINCGRYEHVGIKWDGSDGHYCASHVLGTTILGVGTFALGMPKGFCKAGYAGNGLRDDQRNNTMLIRVWEDGHKPGWDNLNVPVWALESEGFLFVRTYQPRINFAAVDIVENGTLHLTPNAINVSQFMDEID